MTITSPVVLEGFEHGVTSSATNGAGLCNTVAGTWTITTSNPRGGGSYGQRSFQLNTASGSGYWRWTLSNPTRLVCRLGVRFNTSLPSLNCGILLISANSGTDMTLRFNSSSSKLELGAGSFVASTNTISADTWYLIDVDCNLTGNPNTYDWKIDGVSQTQATQARAADSAFQVSVGSTTITVCNMQIDDVAITTTGTDYPIGNSYIVPVSPNGAGTHSFTSGDFSWSSDGGSNWTNITSTSDDQSAKLGQLPMSGSTNRLRQGVIRTTGYLEHTLNDLPANASTVNAAKGFVSYISSSTAVNQGATGAYRSSDSTFLEIFGNPTTRADMSESSVFYKSALLTLNGTTPAEVNGLRARIGYSGDVTPFPHWLSFLLQVDITVAGTVNLNLTGTTETDTAGTAKITKTLARAGTTETDTAGTVTASEIVSLASSTETDTAGTAKVTKALARAGSTETDTSGTAKITKALPLGVSRETDGTGERQGIIIPAYFYPAAGFGIEYWEALLSIGAPGIYGVVANPATGPGSGDSNYTAIIARCQAEGIRVFGYVNTQYGTRLSTDVDADIDGWQTVYGITDIFFDLVNTDASTLTYFTDRSNHVLSNDPSAKIIFNAGTDIAEGYLSLADIVCNFEGTKVTYDTFTWNIYATGYTQEWPASKFWHLVYDAADATAMDAAIDRAKTVSMGANAVGAGWVYVTDDTAAVTPWDTTATYLVEEVTRARQGGVRGTSLTIQLALGVATETGTAGSVAISKTVPVSGTTEADTAGAAAVSRTVPLSGTTEADVAGTGALAKTLALTGASEADTAGAATVTTSLALSLTGATEADTAGAAALSLSLAASGTTEVDTAGTGALAKTLALTGASEADAAGATSIDRTVPISGATEADASGTAAVSKTIGATGASEADTAGATAISKAVPVSGTSEADAAGAASVSTTRVLSLGVASETDTAGAVALNKAVLVTGTAETVTAGTAAIQVNLLLGGATEPSQAGQVGVSIQVHASGASESDAAGGVALSKALGLASSTEADAAGLTHLAVQLALTSAAEVDAAGAVSASKTVPADTATEADAAGAVHVQVSGSLALAVASETDVAGAAKLTKSVPVPGAPAEGDTAGAAQISLALHLGASAEVDTPGSGALQKSAHITGATEANTAGAIRVAVLLVTSSASEVDSAGTVSVAVTQSLVLGLALESDLAGSASIAKSLPLGGASETDAVSSVQLLVSLPLVGATEILAAGIVALVKALNLTGTSESDQAGVARAQTGPVGWTFYVYDGAGLVWFIPYLGPNLDPITFDIA